MIKNEIWMWRAIDGVSRTSLGYQLGNRSDATIRKLIKKIDNGRCLLVTDEWRGFFRVLPEERHFSGKNLTFPIEATNSDLRHRLARFHRRSKVASRSLDMVHASIKLFEHLKGKKNLEDMTSSLLSFFG